MKNSSQKMPVMTDFKPFLGYGPDDFENAKSFYKDLGFKLYFDGGNTCGFDTGITHRFLVALHHGLDRSSAGMLQLIVENVDDWHAYLVAKNLPEKYPGVKVAEPTITEWGWRIAYVWDPGGYLLHIGHPHGEKA